MWRIKKLYKIGRRGFAGLLAIILMISGIQIPEYVLGSDVWPQKSTAPFYCLDGGKSWKSTDKYELYRYDTLPSALTEVQAKRLFWAYPSNWNALKEATQKYDPEIYAEIASTTSGPNVVKKVKDDGNSKFAWIADHPEIEQRAIAALEKQAEENVEEGKEAPAPIRDAVSEDTAMLVTVPAFGPGSLDTEINLGKDFVGDIANIEAQSVWDNGSNGGDARWVAKLEKNAAEGAVGNQLYEITWKDDSIVIHNNGIAAVNENAMGNTLSDAEKYNKTMIRYKITMRENSGWYTAGKWNTDYLYEWMEFKACANNPGHQRLYKADIKIAPSEAAFYITVNQNQNEDSFPEYGGGTSDVSFQIYRHEEMFKAHYRVKLKKIDDETEMPLKGSQFYLYERFEDEEKLGQSEEDGCLYEKNLNFSIWDGYQIFAEGTTNEDGEISHTDVRTYQYSKTYCDGHGMPDWASVEAGEMEEISVDETEENPFAAESEAMDQNIAAAEQWMQLYQECEEKAECSNGTHFHWLVDDEIYDEVENVLETGVPDWEDGPKAGSMKDAFEKSGCRLDCETTYENFINLRFDYTWREVKARNGYILHGIHEEDAPIEVIRTNASEAGAEAVRLNEYSDEIEDHIWYSGQVELSREFRKNVAETTLEKRDVQVLMASSSDAAVEDLKKESVRKATDSNVDVSLLKRREIDDGGWEESAFSEAFDSYYDLAETDHIRHLDIGNQSLFSYPNAFESGKDYWLVRNHRTEGEIYMNKRDMDLFKRESEEYFAYGDAEGDAGLGGAVYGLFAADDIVHPDSELQGNGLFSNTGVVYKKHDLVAVAVTDEFGNAGFQTYTVKPGMHYNYETNTIKNRSDLVWDGPENRYEENIEIHDNWWIGRPLILGEYYIKELKRSEGYELSINGKSKMWTNYGATFDTPEGIADGAGNVMVSVMDGMVTMEGEDATGTGYDQILFRVSSTGTGGYTITVSGLPEGTEFYRVDSGETEVTGPRVVGTEKVIVYGEDGEIQWKTAENNRQYLKYRPEYDEAGNITGQKPISQSEWQILTDKQVPEARLMEISDWALDVSDNRWNQNVKGLALENGDEDFFFLKSELEAFLRKNGYETPKTYDGLYSQDDEPVYSMGVKKGEVDVFGMTTQAGNLAPKTVYGAAIEELVMDNVDGETSLYEVFVDITEWYMEHPQWSFGGLHALEITDEGYRVILYAGASTEGNRRFFMLDQEADELMVDKVYAVVENPATFRWEYQEYTRDGQYRFEESRKYFYGSGEEKRYYIDVTLSPAVMVDANGELQSLEHTVMVYHEEGEEIVDYLSGDPEHGYRVCETREEEKIEITTELEYAEQDVLMKDVSHDKKNSQYQISVELGIENSFGEELSDEEMPLELMFMAKLPQTTVIVSEEDMELLETNAINRYQVGDEIGYGEYLMELGKVTIGISKGLREGMEDTYIMTKTLNYRSQYKVLEDGDSQNTPVQILERPIKQKIKVIKETEDGELADKFQFKLYLKSNLEDLYCDKDGVIIWLNRFGNTVDVAEYKRTFPELVQKLQTQKTDRRVLEMQEIQDWDESGNHTVKEVYNYRKFFDAIQTANLDKWENADGQVKNTSSKPFTKGLYSEIENEINTSIEAKMNAERSDAVRQFAVTWYLEEKVQKLTKEMPELKGLQEREGNVTYPDEVYDRALYDAILDAEVYLQPFFNYDLDFVYEIMWDSAWVGGTDKDSSTLEADKFEITDLNKGYTYGVSNYLPYGDYVIVEQQPQKENKNELVNRHYRIDAPKEIFLPEYELEDGTIAESSEVPWSLTEPGEKEEMSGYAMETMRNQRYRAIIRIEKTDLETGEPILHDDSIFALYRAEKADDEMGEVKRYTKKTLIAGSRLFLEAMGARQITPFARSGVEGEVLEDKTGEKDKRYWGYVPAGTPVCKEEDGVLFVDQKGVQQGAFLHMSTTLDCVEQDILQNAGYIETPEPVNAGVYVLAELKAPAGYARSKPTAVEIYSDSIQYSLEQDASATAVTYGEVKSNVSEETARIYVSNTATSLEIEKKKPSDSYRGMKVSGRVEGSKSALDLIYGLENLELAYNSVGTYQNFGWKKGTLEYLESRKESGEIVELVYENGVFQGYGYIRKKLETSEHENPYVAGATLALFDAIEVRRSGNSEDFAFHGVEVKRDRSGNVTSIKVKEGYAGETEELIRAEGGTWEVKTTPREDTEVLFFDLHDLKVLETAADGTLYGYDRNAQKIKITFDTESIFAIRNGKAEFELHKGDFRNIKYDKIAGAFVSMDSNTMIYHLNEDLCRDAQVDGYTGLAYIERKSAFGSKEATVFVWPVKEIKNSLGNVIAKEKILTGRPGEVNAGTKYAYMTGTVTADGQALKKEMSPVYDSYGMVKYYPESENTYKVGEDLYDRDGEFIGYRCEDLLKEYNRACYGILDPMELYGSDRKDPFSVRATLKHRKGEAWLIPNVWTTGELYPQDPSITEMTEGQKELLRRVVPGTYIMEELKVPEGYVRAMPVAVSLEDTAKLQRASMVNERIKVEIAKVDGTDQYKKMIVQGEDQETEWSVEQKGAYTGNMVLGAKLALYRAKRVYTSDYSRYPKGYYLVKSEETPASWYAENPESHEKCIVEAVWFTDGRAKYFEGIPAGDYILEELETPKGYVPASMEITVNPVEEMQSFILKDDHIKVEIYKYEKDDSGNKVPLPWPYEAELTLYPAVVDDQGKPVIKEGEYVYKKLPVMTWTTGLAAECREKLCQEYENMYRLYGPKFETFTWQWRTGGETQESQAILVENRSTANGETVTQLWQMENQSLLRITIGKNDGAVRGESFGNGGVTIEYQFDYTQSENAEIPDLVSYELLNGIRRMDRIPKGTYILIETKVPNGYKMADPMVIVVEETDAVQRFFMENEKEADEPRGKLIIKKTDVENEKEKLCGAVFEVKNLQSGETFFVETDEYGRAVLEELPIKGVSESGVTEPCIYQIKEVAAPDGYCLNPVVWTIRFLENGSDVCTKYLAVKDKKTKFSFKKSDYMTGEVVPGATLSIYEARMEEGKFSVQGEAIETWISSEEANIVEGKLSCGKTYLLVEEGVPDGYVAADPIRFTISADGTYITDLSKELVQVLVVYEENMKEIAAISVAGQAVKEIQYALVNGDGDEILVKGKGQPIIWNQVMTDMEYQKLRKNEEILITEEYVEFWDGSRMCLEREHLRSAKDSNVNPISSGRCPIATEYVLKNADGVRLDAWSISSGTGSHRIENLRNMDGTRKFQIGETYVLEQFVTFQDGIRKKLQEMSIHFRQGGDALIEILNRETQVTVKKTDITTGMEMPGAVLAIKDENGVILEQWVSSEEEHVVEGILNPGETYVLTEILAADGYAYAEEIAFVLHEDGPAEKIIMEDRLTEVQIQKTDQETGDVLSGAVLCLKNAEGEVIEQWVSANVPHIIKGKLIAGATYVLEECAAPHGYCLAEPMTFVVSSDGSTDQIVMENYRIQIKEESEEEETEEKKSGFYGTITVEYEVNMEGDGVLRIRMPEDGIITMIPKTGDSPFPWWAVCGASLAFLGCIVLLIRRNEHEK